MSRQHFTILQETTPTSSGDESAANAKKPPGESSSSEVSAGVNESNSNIKEGNNTANGRSHSPGINGQDVSSSVGSDSSKNHLLDTQVIQGSNQNEEKTMNE